MNPSEPIAAVLPQAVVAGALHGLAGRLRGLDRTEPDKFAAAVSREIDGATAHLQSLATEALGAPLPTDPEETP